MEYFLSEPSDRWRGWKGRVDGTLLQEFLLRPDGSKCFVCVCGPTAFTELTVRWVNATPVLPLISMGWKSDHLLNLQLRFAKMQDDWRNISALGGLISGKEK